MKVIVTIDRRPEIADPEGIEGKPGSTPGLGLLDVTTELTPSKRLETVAGHTDDGAPFSGYEMHIGRTTGPDTARARTYWAAWTDIGPDHCGYYLDEFRKVGEEWLIAHRRVRLDWESKESLYMNAVTATNPEA